MKSKEFDDLVRQSFDNARLPYNPENWQKLSAVLPEKKSRGIRYLLLPIASIAASVAMAVGITTFVNHSDDHAVVVQKTAATGSKLAHSSVNNNNIVAPSFEDITPIEPVTAPKPLPVVRYTPKANKEIIPVENKIQEKQKDEILVASNTKPLLETNNNNVFYQNITPARKEKRTYISMNAGYNYGTLKSGYSMGISVGRKLNDKFYVEADVALVGNMAGNNNKLSFTTNNPAAFGKYTDAPAQITKTIEVQKYYNIFYAQVAPTVGMKLSHKVAVGMGADVQRLLADQKLTVQTSDAENNQKQLPLYDMGLNVKTEYSLTKEIKASLQYRKGLNQALSGDKQMLDRDYLQLQLKFNILNK